LSYLPSPMVGLTGRSMESFTPFPPPDGGRYGWEGTPGGFTPTSPSPIEGEGGC
jgi:hypothetical protein